jgi:hypothetical protein
MTHYNVHSLGGDGIFLGSQNKGYVVQSTMWNNLESQLFWIATGRVRLDREMVASVLAA